MWVSQIKIFFLVKTNPIMPGLLVTGGGGDDFPERKKIIHQEFKALKLSDMRIIATLGVGKSN